MGGSLLDFVMTLVRDPAVSARFAADPAGVLEEADLPGITVADVHNLIPVVTDSLAAATPGFGVVADSGNVWASSAAAAAFDAFDIHLPAVEQPDRPTVTIPGPAFDQPGRDYRADQPGAGQVPATDIGPAEPEPDPVSPDWVDGAGWHPQVEAEHNPGEHPGFDLF